MLKSQDSQGWDLDCLYKGVIIKSQKGRGRQGGAHERRLDNRKKGDLQRVFGVKDPFPSKKRA
jgi:hypothetical protein